MVLFISFPYQINIQINHIKLNSHSVIINISPIFLFIFLVIYQWFYQFSSHFISHLHISGPGFILMMASMKSWTCCEKLEIWWHGGISLFRYTFSGWISGTSIWKSLVFYSFFLTCFLLTHVQFLIHQFLSTNSVNHLGLRMIWVCLKNAGYPIHGHFDNLMIDHASDLEGRNFETAFLWHFLCGDAGSKLEVLLIMTAKKSIGSIAFPTTWYNLIQLAANLIRQGLKCPSTEGIGPNFRMLLRCSRYSGTNTMGMSQASGSPPVSQMSDHT